MDPITIFFAVLAGIICYQLYTVLGRKDGHEEIEPRERPLSRPTIEGAAKPVEEPETIDENSPAWLREVINAYPDFDQKEFIRGAKSAYEMIVEAFARGDLGSVKAYIAPSVFQAFATAVDARKSAGQKSEIQFVGIDKADIADAMIKGNRLEIIVDFASDQIRVLRGPDDAIIDGDPNRIDLVKDRWTFFRSLNSSDPNWQLVATGGIEPAAK